MKTLSRLLPLLLVASSASAAPFWIFQGTETILRTSSNGFVPTASYVVEVIDPNIGQITPVILGHNNNTGNNFYVVAQTQGPQITKVPYSPNGGSYTVIAGAAQGGGTVFAQFIKGNNAPIQLSSHVNDIAPLVLSGVAGNIQANGNASVLDEYTIVLNHNLAATKAVNDSVADMTGAVNQVVNYLRTVLGFKDQNGQ